MASRVNNGGAIIEFSVNHDSDLLRSGLSKPGAHSDMPFDWLRANGRFVMLNGKLNR